MDETIETRTIGAARVSEFDRLMGTDDIATINALRSLRRELVMPMLSGYTARLLKIDGDLMLFQFESSEDAVLYGVNLQRAILSRNASTSQHRKIELLFGVHFGDVIFDERDVYGEGLAIAAGVAENGPPGGLCISKPVNDSVAERLALPFEKAAASNREGPAASLPLFVLSGAFIAEQPESDYSRGAAVSRARIAVREGTQLNDAYEIDRFVGTGGMGEIYRAHEIQTGDAVAIKLIRSEMEDDRTVLSLFQKEALILKNINHEAVVRYYAFSLDQMVGRRYLAMEYVNGPSLSALIKRGPLSFEAVDALRQRIASGLHVAHERGIVHRDLTPDNIILPDESAAAAKIIDFGIARATDLGGATIIGDGFAGKYNYVSPEQLGLFGADVTAKSDIYSFGLVLAAAATGKAINMGGSHADTVNKRRAVPNLEQIDERLRPLLAAMLQPKPENRPASMAEVAAWRFTGKAARGGTATAQRQPTVLARRKPASPARTGGGQRSQNRRILLVAGIACVAVTVGAFALYYSAGSPVSHLAETSKLTPGQTPDLSEASPTDSAREGEAKTKGANEANTPPASGTPADQPGRDDASATKPKTPAADTPPPSGSNEASQPPQSSPPDQLPTSTADQAASAPKTPAAEAPAESNPSPAPSPDQQSASKDAGQNDKPASGDHDIVVASRETRDEEVRGQVRSYDGGPCFFARATSASTAAVGIEAFASSSKAFDGLDEALTKSLGFEPDIVGNVVWSRQCSAIRFLKGAQIGNGGAGPAIFLKSVRVKNGQPLSGSVSGSATESGALFDVREDGTVENLSSALVDKGGGREFDVTLSSQQPGQGPFPHLLLFVAGKGGLQGLPTTPTSSDALFDALKDRNEPLQASAKLVLVGK